MDTIAWNIFTFLPPDDNHKVKTSTVSDLELGWDRWDIRDTIDGLLATANDDYLDYYNDPNIDPNATPISVPFVPFLN